MANFESFQELNRLIFVNVAAVVQIHEFEISYQFLLGWIFSSHFRHDCLQELVAFFTREFAILRDIEVIPEFINLILVFLIYYTSSINGSFGDLESLWLWCSW